MKATINKFPFLILLLLSYNFLWAEDVPQDVMNVHYIDVGQGDATLLEFPCGAVLIDAGAQDEIHKLKLVTYLESFFMKREDLERTIDLVIVTHCHIDHNLALDAVVGEFKVKRYIDNGFRNGSGSKNQKWLQDNTDLLDVQ